MVTVPHDRKPRTRQGVRFSYRHLAPEDVIKPGVTSAVRTVLDCATTLPFGEALAIADSALRHGNVDRDELLITAAASPSRGRRRRLRVVRAADGRAANPFESFLRSIALEVGLDVQPQAWIHAGHRWVRPDLLDDRRGLAIEAESFTWHGQRDQLTRDCAKYNDLTLLGLDVLRFSWEQVFLEPDYVRKVFGCAGPALACGRVLWRPIRWDNAGRREAVMDGNLERVLVLLSREFITARRRSP